MAFLLLFSAAWAETDLLTQQEREWLHQHGDQFVAGYDAFYPPLEFEEQHAGGAVMRGMSAEVLQLVEERIGFTFRRKGYHDWRQLMSDLKSGETVFATGVVLTPERQRFADFTTPYHFMPVVLVTKQGGKRAIEEFAGKSVCVVDGYASEEFVRTQYGHLVQAQVVDSVSDGLRKAAFGSCDALAVGLGAAAYYIRTEGLSGLQAAVDLGMEYPFCMAVPKAHPILSSILSKGLAAVPRQEIDHVVDEWTAMTHVHWYLDKGFIRVLQVVGLAVALALAGMAVQAVMLKRRLRRQVEELAREQEMNRLLVEYAPVGIFRSVPEGRFVSVNEKMAQILGYRSGEEILESLTDLASQVYEHPEDRARLLRDLEKHGQMLSYELPFKRKDGSRVWVILSLRSVRDSQTGDVHYEGFCQDVTSRRLAEEALRESEKLFRAIFNQSRHFLGLLSVDGTILLINRQALTFVGKTLDQVAGQPFANSAWWNSQPEAQEQLRQDIAAAARGELVLREVHHYGSDGQQHIIDFTLTPFRNDEGDVVYLIPEGRDVTESRMAQKALQESRQRLEMALEAARAGIYEIKPREDSFYASDGCYRMLGLEPFAFPSTLDNWAKQLHPEDRPVVLGRYKAILNSNEESFAGIVYRTLNGAGSWMWVQSRLKAVEWDEQGLAIRLVGVVMDVDETKQAEELVKASEITYRELFNAVTDAIMALTPGELTISDVNKACLDMFGFTYEAVLGMRPEEAGAWDPAGGEMDLENIAGRAEKGETVHFEWRGKRKNGQVFWTENSARMAHVSGKPRLMLSIRDVTERRRLEEIMIQSEKMMSVGGLAAGMAHEINNPLSVILQAAQNVRRRLTPGLPANRSVAEKHNLDLESMRAYMDDRNIYGALDALRSAGERAAGIVRNMLAFSRKTDSTLTPVDLNKLLDDAVELAGSDYDLKKRYDFRSMNLVKVLAEGLPPTPCSETELQQVIINLLRNSSQALNEAKREDPAITLRTRKENGWAVIEIEDNGPGMTPEVAKRVFEPFFTTKEVGKGTGLGLSVSYFIITRRHKGQFFVESQPGEWTRFTIKLPFFPGPPSA